MSKAGVEQALIGLIPTLNGPLPPELVELALSLLARSRSVAHSLKVDEEIARPYACSQLACERLKKRLNLPTITSRPPCPPRIYKKLYKYLESALPEPTSRAPETPRKTHAQTSASARTTPKTPLSARKTPRSGVKHGAKADGPPEWIMPTIRALLKAFEYPLAAPHVYTGVESTLPLLVRMAAASAPETPSKRPRRAATALQTVSTDISDTKTLALVVVILFYVLARMKDQETTPEQFEEWREKALMTLISSPPGNDCSEDEINTEIESLMPLAQQEGWLGMEWFSNIAPAEQEDIMDDLEITNGRTNSRKRSFKESFKSENIGLGTMMQETTDYLGERQREDYRMWKAKIMARVEEVEGSRKVVISH